MSAKKLLFVTVSVVCINTSAYGEWGRIACLKECTDVSCSDPKQMETCLTNCPDSALAACKSAKSKSPTPMGLPQKSAGIGNRPLPAKPAPLPPPRSSVQKSAEPAQPVIPSSPNAAQDALLSQHHTTATGGERVTAEQMFALNEGKGVKVKHMKDKFEGVEKLIPILEVRIKKLGRSGKPFFENLKILKEETTKYEAKLGFNNPEIRNNPEADIPYDPAEFSTISGVTGTLNSQTCEAARLDIQKKNEGIRGTFRRAKSKAKLLTFAKQLADMCNILKTKDPTKEPKVIVQEAQDINRVYIEADKIIF